MNFTVAPCAWSGEVGEFLARSVSAKFGGSLAVLRAEVEAGACALVSVRDDAGELRGAAVLGVDRCDDGTHDGVIHHVAGRFGPLAVAALLAEFERRFQGVNRIRAHTSRRSVLRFLARRGYGVQEWVLSKTV